MDTKRSIRTNASYSVVRIVREEIGTIESDAYADRTLTQAGFDLIARSIEDGSLDPNGSAEFELLGLNVRVRSDD